MIVANGKAGFVPLERPREQLPVTVKISDVDALTSSAAAIARTCASVFDTSDYALRFPDKPRVAYVTIGTPDYDWGVRVLLRSLRRTTKVPIFVFMNSPWQIRTEVSDVFAIEIPALVRDDPHRERHEFGSTYSKLWSFGLLGFERIIFLDADMLVLKSLDALFEEKEFLVRHDSVEGANSSRFNSGLLAFSPAQGYFDEIARHAASAISYDGGDQGLLNTLFAQNVRYISSEANALKHYIFFGNSELNKQDVRVIHYIVKKPWEIWYREITDVFTIDSEDLWVKFLTHSELEALVSQWRRNQFLAERPRFDATRIIGRMPAGIRLRHVAIIAGLSIACALAIFVAGFMLGRHG